MRAIWDSLSVVGLVGVTGYIGYCYCRWEWQNRRGGGPRVG